MRAKMLCGECGRPGRKYRCFQQHTDKDRAVGGAETGEPYRGKPAVRNFRGGNGNVGIMRSPVRAIALPDGRKITDAVDGILLGKRYLIHDRDPLHTAEFLSLLTGVGVESVKLPPCSPNLNAYASHCTS